MFGVSCLFSTNLSISLDLIFILQVTAPQCLQCYTFCGPHGHTKVPVWIAFLVGCCYETDRKHGSSFKW